MENINISVANNLSNALNNISKSFFNVQLDASLKSLQESLTAMNERVFSAFDSKEMFKGMNASLIQLSNSIKDIGIKSELYNINTDY